MKEFNNVLRALKYQVAVRKGLRRQAKKRIAGWKENLSSRFDSSNATSLKRVVQKENQIIKKLDAQIIEFNTAISILKR